MDTSVGTGAASSGWVRLQAWVVPVAALEAVAARTGARRVLTDPAVLVVLRKTRAGSTPEH